MRASGRLRRFDAHRTLRLTSGGNTESVELDWSGSRPRLVKPTSMSGHSDLLMPFDPHGPLRFNDVCLDVSLDDERPAPPSTFPSRCGSRSNRLPG